jgi:hypothetical protein
LLKLVCPLLEPHLHLVWVVLGSVILKPESPLARLLSKFDSVMVPSRGTNLVLQELFRNGKAETIHCHLHVESCFSIFGIRLLAYCGVRGT